MFSGYKLNKILYITEQKIWLMNKKAPNEVNLKKRKIDKDFPQNTLKPNRDTFQIKTFNDLPMINPPES